MGILKTSTNNERSTANMWYFFQADSSCLRHRSAECRRESGLPSVEVVQIKHWQSIALPVKAVL